MPFPRALLFFLVPLAAAQVGQNRPPDAGTPAFRTATQLVVETVVVKDRGNRPIANLTSKDFVLAENGVPQEIRFIEYQRLEDAPATAAAAIDLHGPALPGLTRSQIAPEAPGDTRYRNRRLLALYFDFSAMRLADQVRALQAAKRFVRTQMTEADLLALMGYRGGAVQVFQDFTPDRSRLLETLETMIAGEDEDTPVEATVRADTGAAFGQNDAEFNIFSTDRQLAALQTAASMLGRLSEKKSLIYFASGLRLNGTDNQAQLNATINAALRAGVSFWPVDCRGLVAQAPLGDAASGTPGGAASYSGVTVNAVNSAFQRSQDTLWTLAADTGGKALLDSNDLTRGIVEAQRSISSYYILGYYTTNSDPDGKYRRIKIGLTNGVPAALEYRQGYYASKVFGQFTLADKERQLEDALRLGDPVTELTMALELGYFQLNRAEYFVPVTVKIPGSELALARKGGAERTMIDFVAEIKDDFGVTATNIRDKIEIKLTGTIAADLVRRPIEYNTGFTLFPGPYRIKFLARDAVTGRMGTFEMPFVIPDLNREQKRIAISSVVLGSQRVPLMEAIYSAGKARTRQAVEAVNPLVLDGQKLIPSVTRVFSRSKEMFVYFQAYQQGEKPAHPLLAFVTFYRAGRIWLETAPIEATQAAANRLKTIPVRFSVPLDGLADGEYLCQVSVLDADGGKAAFWRANVMLVP